jgi:hypothetical protein
MICDVLSDAVVEIRDALKDDRAYGDPELRSEIEKVLAAMTTLRGKLDRPPPAKARAGKAAE